MGCLSVLWLMACPAPSHSLVELQDLPRTDNTHQIHWTEAERSGSNDGSPQTNTHKHTDVHAHTHTHVEVAGTLLFLTQPWVWKRDSFNGQALLSWPFWIGQCFSFFIYAQSMLFWKIPTWKGWKAFISEQMCIVNTCWWCDLFSYIGLFRSIQSGTQTGCKLACLEWLLMIIDIIVTFMVDKRSWSCEIL